MPDIGFSVPVAHAFFQARVPKMDRSDLDKLCVAVDAFIERPVPPKSFHLKPENERSCERAFV